jgi:hypothetical protein
MKNKKTVNSLEEKEKKRVDEETKLLVKTRSKYELKEDIKEK